MERGQIFAFFVAKYDSVFELDITIVGEKKGLNVVKRSEKNRTQIGKKEEYVLKKESIEDLD